MTTFQLARTGFAPELRLQLSCSLPRRFSRNGTTICLVRCRLQENGGESNREEPPESLFMKELKRRGMTPTSLLEDSERVSLGPTDTEEIVVVRGTGQGKRNGLASAELEKGLDQRARSMSLNSEGLEGLIPRAKLLLTIGGTFFLGFWPLMLVTFGLFAALYIYFGPSFVHDASKMPASPPSYIDPYVLLEDERLSQVPPLVN